MGENKPPPASRGIRNASAGLFRRIADRAFRPRESEAKEKRIVPTRAKFGKVPTVAPPGVPERAAAPMLRRSMNREAMSSPPAPTRRPPDPIQPQPVAKILRPGKPPIQTVKLDQETIKNLAYGIQNREPFPLGHNHPQDTIREYFSARATYFYTTVSIAGFGVGFMMTVPNAMVRVVTYLHVAPTNTAITFQLRHVVSADIGTTEIQRLLDFTSARAWEWSQVLPEFVAYSLGQGERLMIANIDGAAQDYSIRGFFIDFQAGQRPSR